FDPLIVHLADAREVRRNAFAADADDPRVALLAARLWPGPLTIVLRKRPTIPGIVTAGDGAGGARAPQTPAAPRRAPRPPGPPPSTYAPRAGGELGAAAGGLTAPPGARLALRAADDASRHA